MKLHLPSRLRAALIAAIISVSSYTISSANAAGVAESREELTTRTLTELNLFDSTLYPNPSAYQLQEVIAGVELGLLNITKYLFDPVTGTYTPVQYNVIFGDILGDEEPVLDALTYFKWEEKNINPKTDKTTIRLALEPATEVDANITAYSSLNERLEHSGEKQDFTRSFVGLKYGEGLFTTRGGALNSTGEPYSNMGEIGTLKGDFIGNSNSASASADSNGGSSAYGGSIYNNQKIDNIIGNFIGNSASVSAYSIARSQGGGIYSDGSIGHITGDFIGNSTYSVLDASDPAFLFDSASAASYGGAIYSNGREIETITGDFIGNSVYAYTNVYIDPSNVVYTQTNARGGAIYSQSKIGSIKGDFIGNSADAVSDAYTDAFGLGGAIYNYHEITSIVGDFIGNSASSNSSSDTSSASGDIRTYVGNRARGGAIYNDRGTIGSITGNFIGNSTFAKSSALALPSALSLANSYGGGGAIYNDGGTITNITGDFIGNSVVSEASAITSAFASAQGGAIVNYAGSIGFLALDRSMQFTGNFTISGDSTTKSYEAIYNDNSQSDGQAILNFNAYDINSIVVNDGINGGERHANDQLININNGFDEANDEIVPDGKAFSTVAFNSFVKNQQITVHAGTLELGIFAGGNGLPAAEAQLDNSSLSINTNARVDAFNASALGVGNSITNNGALYIEGGELSSAITGTGSTYVTADMSSEAAYLSTETIDVASAVTLTLSGSATLNSNIIGNGQLSIQENGKVSINQLGIEGSIAAGATLSIANSQLEHNITGTGTLELRNAVSSAVSINLGSLTLSESLSFVGSAGLEIADAITFNYVGGLVGSFSYDIITWQDGATMISFDDYSNALRLTISGEYNPWALATQGENSYGIHILHSGEYDPNAGYKLVATTAENAGVFTITTYDYDSDTAAYKSQLNNVVFESPLGDQASEEDGVLAAAKNFRWEKTDGLLRLKEVTLTDLGDIYAYSRHNERLEHSGAEVDITRSFLGLGEGLTESYGGALNNTGDIGTITGDFIGNSASAFGGAVYNSGADSAIAAITGDFIGNSASSDSDAYGGAVYNESGTITSITGDFVGNSAYGYASAFGAALYNESGTITSITGDFVGNSASSGSDASGAAVYNVAGSIGFLALDRSMQFTGNYTSGDGGTEKVYEAIYNTGTLRFNAYDTHSIVVNDGIDGSNGTIHINSDLNGAGEEIGAENKTFSTVAFNSFVNNQNITVYAGTLELGGFASDDLLSTSAQLNNSSLTINTNARVDAFNASALGTGNSITNNGALYINGGELKNAITGTGSTYVTANMSSEAAYLSTETIDVASAATLTLSGSATLNSNITGDGQLSIIENAKVGINQLGIESSIAAGATLSIANSQLDHNITGTGTLELRNAVSSSVSINLGSLILSESLGFTGSAGLEITDTIAFNYVGELVGSFSHDLITWEDGASMMSFEDYSKALQITIRGEYNPWAVTTQTENSYGIHIVYSGEYDPNAGYKLVSTTAANAGVFTVTTYDYDTDTAVYKSQLNNVVFESPLGDQAREEDGVLAAAKNFRWEKTSGRLILREVGLIEDGDILAYSSHNERLDHSGEKMDITRSFIGLTYGEGQTLSYGGALLASGDIGTLRGDFIGNSASAYAFSTNNAFSFTRGGAVYNNGSMITSITGDFIGNFASASADAVAQGSPTCTAQPRAEGGAVYIGGGTIASIAGDFIGNSTFASADAESSDSGSASAFARGGAVYIKSGAITSITGDFIGNFTDAESSGSGKIDATATASGGAVYIMGGTIASITGDFIGNFASVSATASADADAEISASAKGGAIFNEIGGQIGFLALERSMQFTGNYTSNDGGTTKTYEAICNAGTLRFNAYDTHSIVVNDGIDGDFIKGTIHINSGRNGAEEEIAAEKKPFSTVAFNSFVDNQNITVHAGTLELGEFASDDLLSTSAQLSSSSLTIEAPARVNAFNASALGTGNSITNNGELYIEGGELNSAITGTGDTYVLADMSSEAAYHATGMIDVASAVTLSLSGTATLNSLITGEGSLTLDGSLHFTGSAGLEITDTITFNYVDELVVSFRHDLITWEDGATMISFEDYSNALRMTISGEYSPWAVATQTENSYGIHILHSGEYDPNAGYKLVSTTAANAGVFTVTTYEYDTDTAADKSQLNNVVFESPLGDQASEDDGVLAVRKNFRWEKTDGVLRLKEVTLTDLGDIYAYSSHNERLEHSGEKQDFTRSFLGLKYGEGLFEVRGGALYNTGDIGKLTGDFVGNSASADASANGGAVYNNGTITSITGDFIGNSADASADVSTSANGGAVYNNVTITSITGDFVGNSASASTYGDANGGAVSNLGTITSIIGDFIGNSAFASSDEYASGNGGAVSNNNTITSITGDFIGNSATAKKTSSTAFAFAHGGAVYNFGEDNTITSITGDFIGNFASGADNVSGGAVYNVFGSIGFLALDRSMQFTGNYISSDGGTTKNYEAIYNRGTLRFNAYSTHSIVINDSIDGHSGAIHINSGLDGSGAGINEDKKSFSTVAFNSTVQNQNITVYAGTLELGEFAGGKDLPPATSAELKGSSLTINTNARVDAFNASALGTGNSITNNGKLYINGGELKNAITGTGYTYVTADMSSEVEYLGTEVIDVAAAVTLSLSGTATLNGLITGEGSLSLEESLHLSSTAGLSITNEIIYNYTGGLAENSSHDLITWENGATMISFEDYSNALRLTVNGEYRSWALATQNGNSYGIHILYSGEYDPNAGYKLVATAPANAGVFTVTTYDYDTDTAVYKSQLNNVVFESPLGDKISEEDGVLAARKNFRWENTSGRLILNEVGLTEDGDILAYSSHNERLEHSGEKQDFTRSFLALTKVDGNASALYSTGEIGTLTGDFIGNSASANDDIHGGALYNGSKIGNMEGDFIGNSASTDYDTYGGALHNQRTIGSITGDFIGNTVSASGKANGGALSNLGTITSIIGDFIGNSASTDDDANGGAVYNYYMITALTGDFIGNSVSAENYAKGGAVYNYYMITALTGDFIGNSAISSAPNGEARGGAIYSGGRSTAFLALDRSMQFTGNYTSTDGGTTRNYEAIYNDKDSLYFNAYDTHSIVVNDAISGFYDLNYNYIYINLGENGVENDEINADGKPFSTVAFNSTVENQRISVLAGTLVLGEFAGGDGLPATSAELKNSALSIYGNARVNAFNASALGTGNNIANNGQLYIEGGELKSIISGRGSLEIAGKLTASSSIVSGILVLNDSLSFNGTAYLTIYDHITYNYIGELSENLSQNDIITWETGARMMSFDAFADALRVRVNGVYEPWAAATQDGNSYGFTIVDVGEYNENASYSLMPTTQEKGTFNVLSASVDPSTKAVSTTANALIFTDALGDDYGVDSATPDKIAKKQFQWQVDSTTGKRSLEEVALNAEGDLFAYSSYNERISGAHVEAEDIERSFIALSNEGNGGAISLDNTGRSLGDIDGDFVGNSVSGSYNGGAIYANEDDINAIGGHFVGNSAESGGALAVIGGSQIGTVTGHFIGNTANSHGGAIYSTGSIKKLTGDFIGNQANLGGAIYVNSSTNRIEEIYGNFLSNEASYGGAINNVSSTIDIIEGDFVGNKAEQSGGAIRNTHLGVLKSVTGNFIANSSKGQGGAILNQSAAVAGVGATEITLNASTRDMLILGNHNANSGASSGIYNIGDITAKTSAIVTLSAQNGHSLEIHDHISGSAVNGIVAYQFLNITGDGKSTVAINNGVNNQSITVADGGMLQLGSFAGTTLKLADNSEHIVAASQANLDKSNLTIEKGGTVSAQNAAYLDGATSVTNKGTLNLATGSLTVGISNTSSTLSIQGSVTLGTNSLDFSGENNLLTGQSATRSVNKLIGNSSDVAIKLDADGQLTIEHLTLEGVSISQELNSKVILDNVTFDKGTLDYMNNATLINSTYLLPESDISDPRMEDFSMLQGGSTQTTTYTLTGLGDLFAKSIEGELTLDLGTMDGFIADELVAFKLDGMTDLGIWYGDIHLTINGTDYVALGATNTAAAVYLFIPEPSTVTLSLLALTALLARRRRTASAS